ncbi:hypothetical protein M153_16340002379 [Pseudoloma neurophilia]|uniref:Uncharacterized protein n=1 Tax=Pseudoloma neurophilia TaxID=146866 RepID=A0A0R0LUZ4_9MICR|nr:hypothetical protein M153_16340002379 [Pseudoloma neurophilia]
MTLFYHETEYFLSRNRIYFYHETEYFFITKQNIFLSRNRIYFYHETEYFANKIFGQKFHLDFYHRNF